MPSSITVYDALSLIADFDDALADGDHSPEKRRNLFVQHLQRMDKLNFTVPQFKEGLDWLNVSESLSWDNALKDQLVVLDFFTYCCVNCLHILPDLKVLEETHPPSSGVTVIGVHSAKFDNEKVTANILSAVLRYGIRHPVVNDAQASMWQELSVSCWPTLLFVGPSNQLLYTLIGEGHLTEMMEFVEIAKGYYSSLGQLKPKPLPIALEEDRAETSGLSFPGKICFWSAHNWIVISDTGNHRIVIADATTGVVQLTVGNGLCGFKDGSYQETQFSSPQGIACLRDKIFIADTGNHAVRVINLSAKTVNTIVGTGSQGTDKEGGKTGTQQEIASPWDLALGHSKNKDGAAEPDVLYIAVAGSHQIWAYFLQDALWHKGKSYTKGTCVRWAGSGAEENRNNSYPEKAGFAQPSGLAISRTRNVMYIADSESSSIRSISLTDGKVSGVVGAEKDPVNLFASGDADGKGVAAKLQHPLGVSLMSQDGPLVVADSYNHKLKTVDLETNTCTTLSLTNLKASEVESPKDSELSPLNEPGGLDTNQDNGILYVADTNHHAIKVVDFKAGTISKLPIISPDEEQSEDKTDSAPEQLNTSDLTHLPDVTVSTNDTFVTLLIPSLLKEGQHVNTEAPNRFTIHDIEGSLVKLSELIPEFSRKGTFKDRGHGNMEVIISLREALKQGSYTFQVSVRLFACLDEGNVCLPPSVVKFKQIVHIK